MTEESVPAEAVVSGLKTKSDKIRQLAKAGYARAEIARLLGIRYQHVRNVLVAAGMSGRGYAEKGDSQSPNPPGVTPPQEFHCSLLLQAGFQHIGEWLLADGTLTLEGSVPRDPGVYAFSLDDVIVYVGTTLRGLQSRMNQYRRGNPRQRTSARINAKIKASLESEKHVRVLMAKPEQLKWNGLPINTAAGLEVGLIQMIRPAWNIQGGTASSTE